MIGLSQKKHKLNPSVYAGIKIDSNGMGNKDAVSYSGPTYVAIRSGKHASSTAYSHVLDVERLLNLEIFQEFIKCPDSDLVKPVLIIVVDGGPDENPRYQKTIAAGLVADVLYSVAQETAYSCSF